MAYTLLLLMMMMDGAIIFDIYRILASVTQTASCGP
jgi:hypothetical protein